MNVIAFVVSLGLFVGGILLMGYSFTIEGFELLSFFAGLLITSLGVAVPIHVLKRIDG
ncbi:hypothetical protein HD599_000944 [Conyzicola lurida]|jgi:hypothetical protein|uniref:Uncharacterized protein n=1 Tax=Conyzicola lurida TaxID=1172621 RepID=A0A841ALM1_9MICO|nr:hypothetical protein [Conyzicola lurida]MBB5842621.1 hypothetical protein [Conyzicola lurida]